MKLVNNYQWLETNIHISFRYYNIIYYYLFSILQSFVHPKRFLLSENEQILIISYDVLTLIVENTQYSNVSKIFGWYTFFFPKYLLCFITNQTISFMYILVKKRKGTKQTYHQHLNLHR